MLFPGDDIFHLIYSGFLEYAVAYRVGIHVLLSDDHVGIVLFIITELLPIINYFGHFWINDLATFFAITLLDDISGNIKIEVLSLYPSQTAIIHSINILFM